MGRTACLLDPALQRGFVFEDSSSWSRRGRARSTCPSARSAAARNRRRAANRIRGRRTRSRAVEQFLGDRLVASLGVPLPAAVAAAQMHADAAGRRTAARARGWSRRCICRSARPDRRRARASVACTSAIAELGEGGLVDLHIGAAGRRERRATRSGTPRRCRPRTARRRDRRAPSRPRRRRGNAARRGRGW